MSELPRRQIVVVVDMEQGDIARRVDELRGPLEIVSVSHAQGQVIYHYVVVIVLVGDVEQAREWERHLRTELGVRAS